MAHEVWGNNKDANKNQLLNHKLQVINGNHSAGERAMIHYNSADERGQIHNGTAWKQLAFTDDVLGGGDVDHIIPLESDSRLFDDPPTDYPLGVSVMPAVDDDTVGLWGYEWDRGLVTTIRWANADFPGGFLAHQFLHPQSSHGFVQFRGWDAFTDTWTSFASYAMSDHDHDGVYALLAHTHTNIIPLADDANAEADPLTDYPSGVSIMPVSDTSDWNGEGMDAQVLTIRTGGIGWQRLNFDGGWLWERYWTGSAWSPWRESVYADTFEGFVPTALGAMDLDEISESTVPIDFFPISGQWLRVMAVSAGANWGPGTGVGGVVLSIHGDDSGPYYPTQIFYAGDGNTYRRRYITNAWSAWVAYSMAGHGHSAADITSGTLDDARIPSGITRDSEMTSAISTAISNVIGGASSAYDTLLEIQALMEADDTQTTSMLAAINARGRSKAFTIGNGAATSFNCDHNWGHKDVMCQAYFLADGSPYSPDYERTTINRVVVSTSGTALATNAVRVLLQEIVA